MAAGSQKKWSDTGWEPRFCLDCGVKLTLKHPTGAAHFNPLTEPPYSLCGLCLSARNKARGCARCKDAA